MTFHQSDEETWPDQQKDNDKDKYKEKDNGKDTHKTSQELRMLSSVTLNCQATKIVMNSGSQLSEL